VRISPKSMRSSLSTICHVHTHTDTHRHTQTHTDTDTHTHTHTKSAETGKINGIGGPPGVRKLRGPPEAAAPRANRVGEVCRPDVGGMGSQWRHRRNREKKRYRRAARCQQTPGAAGSGCPARKSRGGSVSTREAYRPDVGGMGSLWRHRRNREKKRYRRAARCQQTPGATGSGCPARKSRETLDERGQNEMCQYTTTSLPSACPANVSYVAQLQETACTKTLYAAPMQQHPLATSNPTALPQTQVCASSRLPTAQIYFRFILNNKSHT
jgi:hypothetical protein